MASGGEAEEVAAGGFGDGDVVVGVVAAEDVEGGEFKVGNGFGILVEIGLVDGIVGNGHAGGKGVVEVVALLWGLSILKKGVE